jgi:FkbM family methyltransferase
MLLMPAPKRLIENGHMAVKACRHGTMMFNVHDRFIGRALDLYGEWCEAELRAVAPLLEPGCTVIDVGANIGTHTLAFSKSVGPNGRVIAFEPQRIVHQILCGNVALNSLTNVVILNAAAGDRAGHVRIPSIDPTKAYNFGAVAVTEKSEGDLVEVVTIDALNLQSCRLIKIDVEGMEPTVILGARETIKRCEPALFVENNTVEKSAAVLKSISSIGYKGYWHISPYFSARNYFGSAENIFAQYQPEANLLCVPKHVTIEGLEPVIGSKDDWRRALQRMQNRKPEHRTSP